MRRLLHSSFFDRASLLVSAMVAVFIPLVVLPSPLSGVVAVAQLNAPTVPLGDPIVCPDGSVRQWSVFAGGPVPGRFSEPRSIVFDGDGNLVVLDSGYARIQRLSPTGNVLSIVGAYGDGPGQLRRPASLTLDPDGNLYVADVQNRRVQKLKADGSSVAEWRIPEIGERSDYEPHAVAVGGISLYVAVDALRAGARLMRADLSGGDLTQVVISGVRSIAGLAADSGGNLYVTDGEAGLLYKLAPTGQTLAVWGQTNSSNSVRFVGPTAVSVGPDGNMYVVDQAGPRTASWDRKRIQAIAPTGELAGTWIAPSAVSGVAVAGDGSLYVTIDGPNPIVQLSPSGQVVRTLGVSLDAPDVLNGARQIVVDPVGNVLVLKGDGLQTFSSSGVFLGTRSLTGIVSKLQMLDAPRVMTMTADGSLYVVAEDRVAVKVSPDDHLNGRWEIGRAVPGPATEGAGDNVDVQGRPEPRRIMDIGVDRAGNVYFTDGVSLHKLGSDGSPIAQWVASDLRPPTTGRERFRGHYLAIGSDDTLYVAGWSLVYRLSSDGEILARFGTPAGDVPQSGPGMFGVINDVGVDGVGNVSVVNDSGDFPVQMLSPKNDLLAMWGSGKRGFNDPLSNEPRAGAAGITFGQGGDMFLAQGDRILKLGCQRAA